MGTRIEIITKGSINTLEEGLVSRLPIRVYNINDNLRDEEISSVVKLLADPISDKVSVNKTILFDLKEKELIRLGLKKFTLIEVSPKPGVNDPEGKETKKAIENIIKRNIGDVSFSRQYLWTGSLYDKDYSKLIRKIGNPLINDFIRLDNNNFSSKGIGFHFPYVDLPPVDAFTYKLSGNNLIINKDTKDQDLIKISEERLLALNLDEMIAIRNLFSNPEFLVYRGKNGLKDMLTDAEVEAIAQKWSEHCCHKRFNAIWEYSSKGFGFGFLEYDEAMIPPIVNSIFKSIIQKTTYQIGKKVDWLVSVFEDNAGVIKLNERMNIAHKVETHNHPSGLDGFGGANTGTGGVLRDPACTGIGMEPVSSQYAFRTASPDSYKDLSLDIQSPARTLETVVMGVEDYGNKMGIPTICGNVFIDDGWLKPAVYVGCVAIAPSKINGRSTHEKIINSGYIALSLGGKVGKDGIHGATASSIELSSDAEKRQDINQSVQIGDPVVEKGVFEVMTILRDLGYIEATQDCGAGGWNSAIGELAEICNGVTMDLTNVPEKYKGLMGWEKLVSEAQERVVIVTKPGNIDKILKICNHNNVDATRIAEFNNSGYYNVIDQNKNIVCLPMNFLRKGLPKMTIKAYWESCTNKEPDIPLKQDLTDSLLKIIGRPNLQSYEWIISRYDHEVQGGSLIKPLVGIGKGKSDAIAYRPSLENKEVVIESLGSNPWQGEIDAYHMGKNNVVDALGKTIALGGNLEKIVFNGNTTCARPENDQRVAAQVIRMLKGSSDAELFFLTPTISGKDSTSMERSYISKKTKKEVRVKAKTELLMSSLCVIKDDSTLTTCDFKLPGDLIYIIGRTDDELGASEFYLMHNNIGRNVPRSDLILIKKRYKKLIDVIKDGLIHSAQYISKGGLAMALVNSSIASNLGVDVYLDRIDNSLGRADKILYSESTGRFVVTVHDSQKDKFESRMKYAYYKKIGHVRNDNKFNITYKKKDVVSTDINVLREKNRGGIIF